MIMNNTLSFLKRFISVLDGSKYTIDIENMMMQIKEETFNIMKHLYNISEMEAGVFEHLFLT